MRAHEQSKCVQPKPPCLCVIIEFLRHLSYARQIRPADPLVCHWKKQALPNIRDTNTHTHLNPNASLNMPLMHIQKDKRKCGGSERVSWVSSKHQKETNCRRLLGHTRKWGMPKTRPNEYRIILIRSLKTYQYEGSRHSRYYVANGDWNVARVKRNTCNFATTQSRTTIQNSTQVLVCVKQMCGCVGVQGGEGNAQHLVQSWWQRGD